MIFYFSSSLPQESERQARFVYRALKKIDSIVDFSNTRWFISLETKLKRWWFKTEYVPTEMLLRKSAHFGLYFGLGFLTTLVLFYALKETHKLKRVIFSALSGVSIPTVTAVLDEYNQLFYNRGSSLNDVIIDMTGAGFGTIVALLIVCLMKAFSRTKRILGRKQNV